MVAYNAVNFEHFLLEECYLLIIISFISFSTLFLSCYYVLGRRILHKNYKHLEENAKLYFQIITSFISIIHGSVILSLIIIFEDNLSVFSINQSIINTQTTKYEIMIASMSMGYFIYQLLFSCLLFRKYHTTKSDYIYMIFHHILSILGRIIIITLIHSGFIIVILLFCNQITDPILHINNIRNGLLNPAQTISKGTALTDLIIKSVYITGFAITRFIILSVLFFQVIFIYEASVIIIIYGIIVEMGFIYLFITLISDLIQTWSKYKQSTAYSQVNEITETEQEEFNIDEDNKHDAYENVLKLSKQSVMQFFMAGVVYSFFHTNRMSVYVLYANEFGPTSLQIAFLLYGSNFWNGMACIIYGAMANVYGYDKVFAFNIY